MNKNHTETDIATRHLLDKAGLEKPSDSFSDSIMGKIVVAPIKPSVKYEPVISGKFWYAFALAIVLILSAVIITMLNAPSISPQTDNTNLYISGAMTLLKSINRIFSDSQISILIPSILACIFILILIDKRFIKLIK